MSPLQYPLGADGPGTRVLEWAAHGPSVVLLHGLGSSADIWRNVAPKLADRGLRVIALDLPGHGFAGKGGYFDYGAASHARWINNVFDHLGLDRAHLVGSSLGGLWASGHATTYPERIHSLSLVGAVGIEPLTDERRAWTAEYLARMDRESVGARLRAAVLDAAVVSDALVTQAWRMNNSPGAAEAFSQIACYYRERINADVQIERLASRSADWPVLLAWGDTDTVVPVAHAETALKSLPESALVLLKATRHIPQLECPEVLAGVLGDFMSGGLSGLAAGPGRTIRVRGEG